MELNSLDGDNKALVYYFFNLREAVQVGEQ